MHDSFEHSRQTNKSKLAKIASCETTMFSQQVKGTSLSYPATDHNHLNSQILLSTVTITVKAQRYRNTEDISSVTNNHNSRNTRHCSSLQPSFSFISPFLQVHLCVTPIILFQKLFSYSLPALTIELLYYRKTNLTLVLPVRDL